MSPALAQETYDVITAAVAEQYFDPTLRGLDWPTVVAAHRRGIGEQRDTASFQSWMNTLLAKLNDSHTQIVPSTAFESEDLAANGTNTFGAQLAIHEGTIFVALVNPNSRAALASLQAGDEIVAIDGQDAAARYQSQFAQESAAAPEPRRRARALAQLLRASPSSLPSQIQVRRAGSRVDVRIDANLIVAAPRVAESEPFNIDIAQLTLRRFQSDALPTLSTFFDATWSRGLLIDLRGNEGGDLAVVEAMAARLFAQNATLAIEQYREGAAARERPWKVRGTGLAARDEPVAVLIDERCASACELFTAALQDNARARVFGHATPGIVAGVTSKPQRLPDGSGLQISRVGFLSPQGRALDNVGVAPDETCARTPTDAAVGEDCVRKRAVRWLSGQIAY